MIYGYDNVTRERINYNRDYVETIDKSIIIKSINLRKYKYYSLLLKPNIFGYNDVFISFSKQTYNNKYRICRHTQYGATIIKIEELWKEFGNPNKRFNVDLEVEEEYEDIIILKVLFV